MIKYQAIFEKSPDREWFFGVVRVNSRGTGIDHHYDPRAGGATLDECREALRLEVERYFGEIKGSASLSIPIPSVEQLEIPFPNEQPNTFIEYFEIVLDSIAPRRYTKTRG